MKIHVNEEGAPKHLRNKKSQNLVKERAEFASFYQLLLKNMILEAIVEIRVHTEKNIPHRCKSWDWIFDDIQPTLTRFTFSQVCGYLSLDICYMRETLRKQFRDHAKTLDAAPTLQDFRRFKREQRAIARSSKAGLLHSAIGRG